MDPLLGAMLGASHLSGTGNFELDLTGRGETIGAAMATAAGSMNVSFREGELRGVNLGRSLCKAVNTARQLPDPAAAPDITPYQIISASATVANGTATTENLYANTGFLELTGRGSIRLVDQTLDTSYVTRLIGPVNLAGCDRVNSRVDGSIPIGFTLKGQLPTPAIAFDIAQLIEDLIKREFRNQAEDAVRDRLEDALRGLLR
jgi:AsmA protein